MHIPAKNLIHRESGEKQPTPFFFFLVFFPTVICPLMESLRVVLSFYSAAIKIKKKKLTTQSCSFPF